MLNLGLVEPRRPTPPQSQTHSPNLNLLIVAHGLSRFGVTSNQGAISADAGTSIGMTTGLFMSAVSQIMHHVC